MNARRLPDPVDVMLDIDAGARRLDEFQNLLGQAQDALDEAEARWDEVYDAVSETLKTEMVEEGRKGDPAEHWVTTQARKEHRVVYQNWRRAKRALEVLERRVRATSAAMNGRQSELGLLRDEARAPSYGVQHREPAPQYGRPVGGRHAA
jgi:hypothetical protein